MKGEWGSKNLLKCMGQKVSEKAIRFCPVKFILYIPDFQNSFGGYLAYLRRPYRQWPSNWKTTKIMSFKYWRHAPMNNPGLRVMFSAIDNVRNFHGTFCLCFDDIISNFLNSWIRYLFPTDRKVFCIGLWNILWLQKEE